MAVITLSWQLGCRGDQLADELAEQLGYHVFGKPEIDALIAKENIELSKKTEVDKSVQLAEEEIQPEAFERLSRNHRTYVHLLTSQIYTIGSRNNAIIKGHGAQIVLAHEPHILRVRLTGSFEYRVATIQKLRNFEKYEAEDLVAKDDRERMGLIRYLFQRENTRQQWYDLMVDVEKFDIPTIAVMLSEVARSWDEKSPMTDDDRQGLQALSLSNRVKAILHKEMPFLISGDAVASIGGIVTLYGSVTLRKEKEKIEQRIRSVSGVQDVVNNIKVARHC